VSQTARRARRRKVDPTITEAGMKQNYDFPAEGEGKPVAVAARRVFH
jgi:hypothetical protein